jgi:hypothetical protein
MLLAISQSVRSRLRSLLDVVAQNKKSRERHSDHSADAYLRTWM